MSECPAITVYLEDFNEALEAGGQPPMMEIYLSPSEQDRVERFLQVAVPKLLPGLAFDQSTQAQHDRFLSDISTHANQQGEQ